MNYYLFWHSINNSQYLSISISWQDRSTASARPGSRIPCPEGFAWTNFWHLLGPGPGPGREKSIPAPVPAENHSIFSSPAPVLPFPGQIRGFYQGPAPARKIKWILTPIPAPIPAEKRSLVKPCLQLIFNDYITKMKRRLFQDCGKLVYMSLTNIWMRCSLCNACHIKKESTYQINRKCQILYI